MVIIISYIQHPLRQNRPTLNTCMSCETCSFIYLSTGLQYTAIPSRSSTTEMNRIPSSSTMNSSPTDVLLTPDSSCEYKSSKLFAQGDDNLEIQYCVYKKYVCEYIRVCVYVYVYIYTYIYIYIICICIYVHMYICIYVCMCI